MRRFSGFLFLAVLIPLIMAGCATSGPHKEAIRPANGGSPLFSPVVRTGNLLFLSGVIGRSADGDIRAATRQALDSIEERLGMAGATMADVVKCTVYLVDMDHYSDMNEAYVPYFPSDPPARTAIAVRELPVNADVEITCVAAVR